MLTLITQHALLLFLGYFVYMAIVDALPAPKTSQVVYGTIFGVLHTLAGNIKTALPFLKGLIKA